MPPIVPPARTRLPCGLRPVLASDSPTAEACHGLPDFPSD